MDLKQLAAEREARARECPVPMPNPWEQQQRKPTTSGTVRSAAAGASAGAGAGALAALHRSVRMGHTLGLILCFLSVLLLMLLRNSTWGLLLLLVGAFTARAGGATVHNMLPQLLREGSTPSQADVDAGAQAGLFCLAGLMAPLASMKDEWAVLLENLAFVCTYGKRNCLTGQMYSGEITLGKIFTLVKGKLSEGVIRCG
eukprot:TRINITY_DN73932_c0_g1_i1.p1 TRINITY_DN73932_c0_g1~~TRINITY_DN73932_c0_g1_i1.p1  ORF type:complete len:217 (+),score=35.79 TRINITY_DN73932_c0_g1_i1:53-652(+)